MNESPYYTHNIETGGFVPPIQNTLPKGNMPDYLKITYLLSPTIINRKGRNGSQEIRIIQLNLEKLR